MNAIKTRIDAAAANRRDAKALLENMNDYGASKSSMVDEIMFMFGYTQKQAEDVYAEWAKEV